LRFPGIHFPKIAISASSSAQPLRALRQNYTPDSSPGRAATLKMAAIAALRFLPRAESRHHLDAVPLG